MYVSHYFMYFGLLINLKFKARFLLISLLEFAFFRIKYCLNELLPLARSRFRQQIKEGTTQIPTRKIMTLPPVVTQSLPCQ